LHGIETVSGEADLPEIGGAVHAACCFPRRLDRGKQQGDQHRHDRDHDQQFDQGEAGWLMRFINAASVLLGGRQQSGVSQSQRVDAPPSLRQSQTGRQPQPNSNAGCRQIASLCASSIRFLASTSQHMRGPRGSLSSRPGTPPLPPTMGEPYLDLNRACGSRNNMSRLAIRTARTRADRQTRISMVGYEVAKRVEHWAFHTRHSDPCLGINTSDETRTAPPLGVGGEFAVSRMT